MPAKVILIDGSTGRFVHLEEYKIHNGDAASARHFLLATTTPQKAHGVFKSVSFTVQATQTIATPQGNGTLEITDIVVTFEKKNLGVVLVQFNDGTHQVPLLRSTLTDGPVNFSNNVQGRWGGWRSAYVEAVLSGADAIGTITLGYVKNRVKGMTYDDWNAER